MSRKAELKAKMAETRAFLFATLAGLNEEQFNLATTNEGWTVRDLAAHVAGAEGGMKVIAERIITQEPTVIPGFDLTRFNAGNIRRRADKTVPDLMEELRQSRAVMLEILDNSTEEQLDYPGEHPAYGSTTLYGLFEIIARHEKEHTLEIQQALEKGMGDRG
jgi:uncharacterized protein (TIGR03083 family)